MTSHLKRQIPGILLSTAVCVSVEPCIFAGNILTDPWSQSLLAIAASSLILQILLSFIAYNRTSVSIGVGIGVLIAIAVFAYMRAYSPLKDEEANSGFIFLLVTLVTNVLVFCLNRSRLGCAFMFVSGLLICCGSYFLQYPAPKWALITFLFFAAVCFFLRVYYTSAAQAEIGRSRPTGYLFQTMILTVAALAIAVGVYTAVVRPLNPPTRELKLITELRSMELMRVLGIYSVERIIDPDSSSSMPPETDETGSEQGNDDSDIPDSVGRNDEGMSLIGRQLRENITKDIQQMVNAIRYEDYGRAAPWLLLIPVAIALPYLIRFIHTRRWLRRVRSMPREAAAACFFKYFLSRFKRIGLKKPPESTLREFAENTAVQTESFDSCGVRFAELTGIYERLLYGHLPLSEEEYQKFEHFFRSFKPSLRREIGTVKYCLTAYRY